jgi:hypothetical protein
MAPTAVWSVVVGNVGTVYAGQDSTEAISVYVEMREQAINGYGKAAGEPVTLMADGEPKQEYNPKRKRVWMRTVYLRVDEDLDPDCIVAMANERLRDWMLPMANGVKTDMDQEWEEADDDGE